MSITITMPALSPTMEEGKLAKWHVKEGDTVTSGDVIAEIETDKATMEVEAIDEGVIGKLMVAEGTDNVKVNTVIAVLLQDGDGGVDRDPCRALGDQDLAKGSLIDGLELHRGLVGFDLGEDLTGFHLVAFLHQPFGQRAFLHRGRKSGHQYLNCHVLDPQR